MVAGRLPVISNPDSPLDNVRALPVVVMTQIGVDPQGFPVYGAQSLTEAVDLVSNANTTVTSSTKTLYGGDYAYSVTGTLNGASVQLQTLTRDGTTYSNYGAARTANDGASSPPGAVLAPFAGNSSVRAVVTGGPPAGLYVSLTRIPG